MFAFKDEYSSDSPYMQMPGSACRRSGFVLVALVSLAVARLACAEAPADTNSPKLSEPFVFNLRSQRDNAVNVIAKSIGQHDEILRAKELESANAPVLTKALDLLRYIPVKFSSSDPDDFFTPNYLQPGYATAPRKTQLFDKR